jgi:hypothetical protein
MKIFGHFLLATVFGGYATREPNFFVKKGYSMPMFKRGSLALEWLKRAPMNEEEQQKRGYSMPMY